MRLRRIDADVAAVLVVAANGVDLFGGFVVADEDTRLRAERKIVAETGAPPEMARARVRELLELWP